MSSRIHLLLLLAVIACSCATQFGTRVDRLSGLLITNHGLSYRSIGVYMGGVKFRGKEVGYGKEMTLHLSGVKGFVQVGEQVFPGSSLDVFDEKGNAVFSQKDLFSRYTLLGADRTRAAEILINLTVGRPMEPGREYLCRVRIWDKRGNGEIVCEKKFRVQ